MNGEPPPVAWPELGGPLLSAPAVESNQDGRLEVVGVGIGGAVWHTWQTSPNNGWAAWSSMRGNLPPHIRFADTLGSRPAIIRNFDGRLEVFALGSDRAIWHIWQTAPNGGWSGWESLGGRCRSDPTVEINDNGRLEIFVVGEDNGLHHQWQRVPNGLWSGWHGMGGRAILGVPAAGHNADRRIAVFVHRHGQLWQIFQRTLGGDWSDWVGPRGELQRTPVVAHMGLGAQTQLVVFGEMEVPAGRQLWHTWQTAPSSTGWPASVTNDGGQWSGVQSFGGRVGISVRPRLPIAATTDHDGRLRLFALWPGGTVRERHQIPGPPGWSDWRDLGGNIDSAPTATINADGRAEVFARAPNGQLVHRWEPFA